MRQFIQKIQSRGNLTQNEIQEVMKSIMNGSASKEDISDFLMSLRQKGPTIDEITGAAKIMRQFVVGVKSKHKIILDTCGTGGDKKGTFNISTLTALVVAGVGVAVAKHGNRSVSSKCGSADILEALGVNLNIEEDHLKECLDQIGVAFLFAQRLHPAMKHVASVRKELGVETIFNILGPLTNPAQATHQMMGVYSRDLTEPLAHVLKNLGLKRALVVHGDDGLDEITTTTKSYISEYNGKEIISYDIDPQELGFKLAKEQDLVGGDLKENIRIFHEVLDGVPGRHLDIVLLNAGYALYTAQKVNNIVDGIKTAQHSIQAGLAKDKLEQLKRFTYGKV